MIENEFIVIPGKGLSDIKFGMYKDDVIKILGEPTEIDDPDEEGDIIYNYENRGIAILAFDKEEGFRLTNIEINKESNAILWNEKLFELSLEQIKKILKRNGNSLEFKYYIEEKGIYQELYTADEIGCHFWFNKYHKLEELSFGVYFNENDEIEWPD